MTRAERLISAAARLRDSAGHLNFGEQVACVYNPLEYAWRPHEAYLRRWGGSKKRVIFLGMNPGPWGMAQTGVPFGEVVSVRDWVGIDERVGRPTVEHPARPVRGFECHRSEVSGARLWGLFRERFGTAQAFFREHFVANYCPLVFMEASGRNVTPDKLRGPEADRLIGACDRHLAEVIAALGCEWVVGVGKFAEMRARDVREMGGLRFDVGRIPHPSPANPAANRGWAGFAEAALVGLGIWPGRGA